MLPVFRVGFGLLALAAIVAQLVIHIQSGFSVVNFFSYFTNLSNLFAAMVLLFAWGDRVRAVSVVNMTVVGLVFGTLLRNADLGSLLPWVNIVLHMVMPCVVLLDWFLQPPRQKQGGRTLLICLIFPVLYLAYTMIRGATTGWYPYPFLNPATEGGAGGVAVYAVGIAITFLLTGLLLFALGNKLRSSRA